MGIWYAIGAMDAPKLPQNIKKLIAPSILVYSKAEARAKLAFVRKNYTDAHLHVDATDGRFVPSRFWCKPHEFGKLAIRNSFEAHLMTFHPEKRIAAWKRAGASRIIFHYEATDRPLSVIDAIHKHRLEAGIALNLETNPDQLGLILDRLDAILFMAIETGWAGQPFHPEVIQKIRAFHKKHPRQFIIVDGGVSKENAPSLISAGVRQLVSTSAVYGKSFSHK